MIDFQTFGGNNCDLPSKKHHPWDDCVYLPTPLKISMAPKNEDLEDDSAFQTGDFQVPCQFPGCTILVDVYGKLVGK